MLFAPKGCSAGAGSPHIFRTTRSPPARWQHAGVPPWGAASLPRRMGMHTALASQPPRAMYSELDDSFNGIDGGQGVMTIAGFGSLLSERSARTTFPDLQNFRAGKLQGFRRVFAHCADVFFKRGIARPETGEMSSLSCEPCPGKELVISLFEVPFSPEAVAAFIEREHEFRFLAVPVADLDGELLPQRAVLCGANTDKEYRARRCPPDEWERRWAVHGIERVWRDDVLPCRVYLRHCVLAARSLSPAAAHSFLHETYLADRQTTVAAYLESRPEILEELPPLELINRYSG